MGSFNEEGGVEGLPCFVQGEQKGYRIAASADENQDLGFAVDWKGGAFQGKWDVLDQRGDQDVGFAIVGRSSNGFRGGWKEVFFGGNYWGGSWVLRWLEGGGG